jgi:hypothetical protein
MIALGSDCLVFRMKSGESVPLSAGMVSVELLGDTASMFHSEFVSHAADAVFYYFKHDLGRESVTVGEFTLALEKVLRGFKLAEENDRRLGMTDLGKMALESGAGFELSFFPKLRNELRSQLRDSRKVLQFRGLRRCVKRLAGAQRWSPRCQSLNDRIVDYLRHCLSAEAGKVKCTLVVE